MYHPLPLVPSLPFCSLSRAAVPRIRSLSPRPTHPRQPSSPFSLFRLPSRPFRRPSRATLVLPLFLSARFAAARPDL